MAAELAINWWAITIPPSAAVIVAVISHTISYHFARKLDHQRAMREERVRCLNRIYPLAVEAVVRLEQTPEKVDEIETAMQQFVRSIIMNDIYLSPSLEKIANDFVTYTLIALHGDSPPNPSDALQRLRQIRTEMKAEMQRLLKE